MKQNVLVIGGTRFFGKLLVEGLLDAGHAVTLATRGHAPDTFGNRVRRLRVDRRDAAAMARAFANEPGFDLVYDQMCYSPLDAAISAETFAGKVGRYVMASTIEVYSHLQGQVDRPLREDDVDLAHEVVDMAYPWHAPEVAEVAYGRGKRQAEAFFHQDGRLPVVCVRIGHVLAGPEDFTGRLQSYVQRVLSRQPLCHAAVPRRSAFISAPGIAAFLLWVGRSSVLGPINAAAHGPLSALDIHQRVAHVLRSPAEARPVRSAVLPSELSPYDFPSRYEMDVSRAESLGHRFDHSGDWLDGLILQHAEALAAGPAMAG
ncbi:MAG TPA: NAD-dependent epimerase/dehydratase family protein [Ideonella sp.]|uniref:NAD-dependent epimerase/dehydratase family protein n=1 Tax=Ideonella sp. TaxID=1929293 RepID=UPI002E33C2AA|nr:NAD-dependent epimerase/dehydratase family protein [Ideonella sp.]HEX5687035.1 NAD-dependent epimerase/dehydratase family protein [Ideonella sp.]